MRNLIVLTTLAAAVAGAIVAMPAEASPRGTNGEIAFARFDPTLGDTVAYTINPDGTHEQQISTPSLTAELPRWSPNGTRLVLQCCDSAALILNPDTGDNVS